MSTITLESALQTASQALDLAIEQNLTRQDDLRAQIAQLEQELAARYRARADAQRAWNRE